VSVPLESLLFNGSMREWLAGIGIGYDQRNALVSALRWALRHSNHFSMQKMPFLVCRTFDGGSLALVLRLGKPWLGRLLTASPGFFRSHDWLGRAVGDHDSLMATGNTPVMDLSVFQACAPWLQISPLKCRSRKSTVRITGFCFSALVLSYLPLF